MSEKRLISEKDIARFWSKVDKSGGPDACWPYSGARMPKGYGVFRFTWGNELSHRVSWSISNARPPKDGLLICHSCDHPWCCNPAHLWQGTDADNVADMCAKGRHYSMTNPERIPRGETQGNSKLTDASVRRIRELNKSGSSAREVARSLGVAPCTVYRVLSGERWGHVK